MSYALPSEYPSSGALPMWRGRVGERCGNGEFAGAAAPSLLRNVKSGLAVGPVGLFLEAESL